jgi:protein-disulfide isomerase
MNKFTVVAVAVLVLCFGGLVLWSMNNRSGKMDFSKYDASTIIAADDNNGNIGDHVRGKADSKVIIVEYADLSCPGCASMMPYMTKLYEEYGDRVDFVFRHFPLQSHPNSRSAAAAIESAAKQDFYWEMLEALYENRSDWLEATGQERTDVYVKIFKEIAPDGNEEQLRLDMNDSDIDKKISFDYNLGKERSGVDATPSIFVNGEKVDIAGNNESGEQKSFEDVVKDIKKMIEKQLNDSSENK